jgi:hypothetical protein
MSLSKIAVFWVVAPCSLAEVYQRFRYPYCLHHLGDESLIALMMEAARTSEMLVNFYQIRLHGATTQKTAIFVLIAVRTSNPTGFFLFSVPMQCTSVTTAAFI